MSETEDITKREAKTFEEVMMKSAMMWGIAAQNKSADLLFEDATNKAAASQAQLTDYLTPTDLPTRISGGDPMHTVTAVMNKETSRLEANENGGDQWDTTSNDFNIGGESLMSSVNMTDYALPKWVMGEMPETYPSWEALPTNRPVFTWCGRATHSDVTCVMNTTKQFRDLSEVLPQVRTTGRRKAGGRLPASSLPPAIATSPFASTGKPNNSRDSKKLCRLPYAGGKQSNLVQVKASTTTLLAKERALESRRRMNSQLVAEKNEFMNKLAADRSIRLFEENEAATKIQSIFRGYSLRPHTEAAAEFKKQLIEKRQVKRGDETLECSVLMKLDDALNLSYIEGVTLPKLRKTKKQIAKEKKLKDILIRSVIRIQSRARILTAKNIVIRMAETLELLKIQAAVIKVQRISRGGLIRSQIRKQKEEAAAATLQTAIRYSLKKRRQQSILITANEQKRELRRQEKASVKLQAAMRGRKTRTSVHKIYGYNCRAPHQEYDSLDSDSCIPEGDEQEG